MRKKNSFLLNFCLTITTLVCLTSVANSLEIKGKSTPGSPPTPSIFVDADQYVGHPDQSADLEGHVTVIRGLEQVTCDKAHVNMKSNEVTATGNVILITPKNFIKADKLDYNFNNQKGVVYNGFIQTGQETIEGKIIYKEGDTEFEALDATYTSCVNCPPAWKISGSKIDATVGSYAYIKNPIIRIANVPIFWLPYMIIPIKTERQSGLLAPAPAFNGADGFTISESYFWNIDKSHDATFTLTNYAARGLKEGIEYRYFADKESRGNFNGNFVPDRVYGSDPRYITPDPRIGYSNGPRDPATQIPRYGFHYDHHFVLPDNYVQNMNINFVRDTNYLSDFPRDTPGVYEPALENRASLSKDTENSSTSMDVDIYQNLLKVDPVGQDNSTVHRVPEFDYFLLPQHIMGTGFLLGLDAQYLNIGRADQGFDTVDSVGNPIVRAGFLTGDRYRTGQRLLFHPDLTYPVNIGDVVDIVPELEYTEARYSFGYSEKPAASRRFFRASLQAKTRLSTVFGEEDPKNKTHKYKHEIEPDVTYTYVPYLAQEEHQFFGSSELPFLPHYAANQPVTQFDEFQFDYRDRLVDRKLVTFGITNKFIQKTVTDTSGSYQEIIRHRISESFDIANAGEPSSRLTKDFVNGGYVLNPDGTIKRVSNPIQPWSEIRSLLEVKLNYVLLSSDISYYPYQSTATNTSTVTLKDVKGNWVSGSYSQNFAIQVPSSNNAQNQTTNSITSRSDAASLRIYGVTKYLDISAAANYDILQQAFTSEIGYILIKPPGQCYGLAFSYENYLNSPKPTFMVTIPIFFGEGKSFTLNHPPGV